MHYRGTRCNSEAAITAASATCGEVDFRNRTTMFSSDTKSGLEGEKFRMGCLFSRSSWHDAEIANRSWLWSFADKDGVWNCAQASSECTKRLKLENKGPVADCGAALSIKSKHSAAASATRGSRLPQSSKKMVECCPMSPISCIAA